MKKLRSIEAAYGQRVSDFISNRHIEVPWLHPGLMVTSYVLYHKLDRKRGTVEIECFL